MGELIGAFALGMTFAVGGIYFSRRLTVGLRLSLLGWRSR